MHSKCRSGLVTVFLILSYTELEEPGQETKWKGGGVSVCQSLTL